MITINRLIHTTLFVIGLLILNLTILFNSNNNYFISLITIMFLSFIPGSMTLYISRVKFHDTWKTILTSVGLSLSFLLIIGLIYNWIGYYILNILPLRIYPLLHAYDSVLIVMLLIGFIRNKGIQTEIKLNLPSLPNLFVSLASICFVFLSIAGAFILNNGGNNMITLIMLSAIALYVLLLIFSYKYISSNTIALSVYCIGLSFLLMLSMRSWYISGWDIQDEFKVFQVTKFIGFWDKHNIIHDYNSCLSITLLPTIYSVLTKFPDEYIYKFFYQVLFAFVPVSIYLLTKKYTNTLIAFLSIFYISSQPFFIQPTTQLMRQEIAFIFFALLVFILFEEVLNKITRNIFFVIFGVSMVLSHYSTSYIAIFLLSATYFARLFLVHSEKLSFVKKFYKKIHLIENVERDHKYYINFISLIFLIIFSVVWYSRVNTNSVHFEQVLGDVVNNLTKIFSNEVRSQEAKKSISIQKEKNVNTQKNITSYINYQEKIFDTYLNQRYSKDEYGKYPSYPVPPRTVPPLIESNINGYAESLFNLLKQVTKFFVIIGAGVLFLKYYKTTTYDREYILFSVVAASLVLILVIHPTLTLHYNLSRFYLQLLIILALPATIGGTFLFSLLSKKIAIYLVGITYLTMYLYFSGVAIAVIGGGAFMHLYNYGEDYDKFYTHNFELTSITWLDKNRDKKNVVFADEISNLRMKSRINILPNPNVIPQFIYKDAYVYGNFMNTTENRFYTTYNGNNLNINFPDEFLNKNKNKIYDNGGSEIFR